MSTSLIEELEQSKQRTLSAFDELAQQIRNIDAELAALGQQEIIEAKPRWQGVYLYLEFPAENSGTKRTRKYVGNKPKNILQALEGIERAQLAELLRKKREFFKSRFYEARFQWNGFFQRLKEEK